MTARRLAITSMPYWPRFLSRDQAAAYVGVSPNVFDAEVVSGVWPRPMKRGERGGHLTWDRSLLDSAADHAAALPKVVERASPIANPDLATEVRNRLRGTSSQRRPKASRKTAA